ncbi:MAG TPA: hypothetical protein VFG37_14045 [Planctomycetota bacterium]|nr:hypothetical protein [Planctomycetota bacterium]
MSARRVALALAFAAAAVAPLRAQSAALRDEAEFIEALARDGFSDVAHRRLDALRTRLAAAPESPVAPVDAALVARVAARLARADAAAAAPGARAEVLRRGSEELAAALAAAAAASPAPDLAPLRLESVELARALAAELPDRDDELRLLEAARLELEHVHVERTRSLEAEAAALPLRPGPDAARDATRERLERAQVDAWLPILDQARLCFEEAERLAEAPPDPERRRVRLRSARELSDQFVSKIGARSLRTFDARLLAGRATLALGDAEGGARRLRRLLEGDEDVAAALDAWPGLDAASVDELTRIAERAVLELARSADEAGRFSDATELEARLETLAARHAGRPEGRDALAARWQIAHARARGGASGGVAALDAALQGATDDASRARLTVLLLDLVDDPALAEAAGRLSEPARRALDGRRSPFQRAVAGWDAARALPPEAKEARALRLEGAARLARSVAPDAPDQRAAQLLALRCDVALAAIANEPRRWSEALARADALLVELAELDRPAGDAHQVAEAQHARAAILEALGRNDEAVALSVQLTAGEPPADAAAAAAWCEAFYRSIAALPATQRDAARARLREFDRRFVAAYGNAADFEARLGGAPWRTRWDELRAALQ